MTKIPIVVEVVHQRPVIVPPPDPTEYYPPNPRWPPDPDVFRPHPAIDCRDLDKAMGR